MANEFETSKHAIDSSCIIFTKKKHVFDENLEKVFKTLAIFI